MKTITRPLTVLACLLCSGTAFAQAHELTYQQVVRQVDAAIMINGDSYRMARIPVRDIVTGNKYSVIFPAPDDGGFYISVYAIASHKPAEFVPNMTIDGYPALVHVEDSVSYLINTNFISGGYDFIVNGTANVSVSIDLGETIVTISNMISAKSSPGDPVLTEVNIGESLNAVPYAEWGKYRDQNVLNTIVNAADKWIDFVRVAVVPY